jgi:hypothetical protein
MKRHIIVVAGLLALCAGPNGARANVLITPTVSAGPYSTDVFNNPATIVNLPLFDSNLGTLTSVSVSETGTFVASALLTNEAPGPESFDFHIAGQFGVNLFSNDLPSNAATALAATVFNAPLIQQHFDLAQVGQPGASAQYGPFTIDWGDVISGLPVADFESPGGGAVALHVDGLSSFFDNPMVIENNDVSYAPFFFDPNGPTGTASLFATYTYTPAAGGVPEPSTWAMILVGFAGLGFAALRRSTKRTLGAIA